MSGIKEFKRLNTRKASVVHVGGFRPTGDPFASHFGLRPLGAEGEDRPTMDGKPLPFVCQLNLTAAPAVPALLQDIALITFFVDPEFGNLTKENGVDWCLRGYPSLSGLVAMTPPADAAKLNRGFECRWEALDDHPNYDDPERVVPDGFDDLEVELENLARTKVGGYSSSIQSEPWWGYEEHPGGPAYCLQINSEGKVGLAWGDGGTVIWRGARRRDAESSGSSTGSAAGVRQRQVLHSRNGEASVVNSRFAPPFASEHEAASRA
jgi:hypothetical protein